MPAPAGPVRNPTSLAVVRERERSRVQLLLASAIDLLVAEWIDNEGYQITSATARTVAEGIGDAVLLAMDGGAPRVTELPPWVASQRLVGRLRSAWLAAATAGATPSVASTLDVMRGFDAVERAVDDDCTQRFVGRLSGPDAARLVVEMAHDMRSALGSILFLAETVRSGSSGPVSPIQQRQLGLIYSAALGLSGIMNDVVDLARGAARILDASPVAFALPEVVASVLAVVRPTAEEKGLELVVTLPDVGTRIGQPAAINRILLNLVSNALKFTESGTVRLDIARGDGVHLVFRVSDTGRGMPPAVVASLFEAFRSRGEDGDEYFSGAGLGLAMCQAMLTRMGSELAVSSVEGHGTTFAFTLSLPFATLI